MLSGHGLVAILRVKRSRELIDKFGCRHGQRATAQLTKDELGRRYVALIDFAHDQIVAGLWKACPDLEGDDIVASGIAA